MGELYHLNVGCADASVIITSTATFLIDCYGIDQYGHLLPATKQIRGVFITHQHSDHYAGLAYLRDNGYSIGCLIYSPYERRYGDNSVTIEEWNEFNSLKEFFRKKGTSLYAPLRQADFSKPYWETDGVKFWMIGPFEHLTTSSTCELHDACLIITAQLGIRNCLFTGDASDSSLQCVTTNTTGFCGDILHASHHGSLNGADLEFIKKCNAKYTVISTESGVYENVPHPTALKRYNDHTTERVFRTDIDGSVKSTF